MSTLAERVASLRKARDWSQSELARRAGITQQNVNSVELGKVKRPRYAHELARALDSSVEFLLTGRGEQRPPGDALRYVPAMRAGAPAGQPAGIMSAPEFLTGVPIVGPLRYVIATASDSVPDMIRAGDAIVVDEGVAAFIGDGVYLLRLADDERLRFCSRRASDGALAIASASPHVPAEILHAANTLRVSGRAVMSVRKLA